MDKTAAKDLLQRLIREEAVERRVRRDQAKRRALTRLKSAHTEEYRRYYEEELVKTDKG